MSTCGGTVATTRIALSEETRQLVGSMETRTRVTIRAALSNTALVYILPSASAPSGEGFPLYPGEGYQLDDRGARVAIYGVTREPGQAVVYVLTEGA